MTSGVERETSAPGPVFSVRRFTLAAIGLFVVWLCLVDTFADQEFLAGAIVAIGVAILSLPHLALLDSVRLRPSLPIHLLRYYLTFARALLHANLDVARRVISPRLDIDPAIVEVHTELTSDLGKMWLANSITLTPGTLTVDVIGQTLRVHWIDARPGADLASATREIAAGFEVRLKEILL